MSKNHIEQVAQMLGVELNESFKIHDIRFDRTYTEDYYFDKQLGLARLVKDVDNGEYVPLTCDWELTRLIMGWAKVVKLSWEPKLGEHYYAISPCLPKRLGVGKHIWSNEMIELMKLKLGMVFKTEEEAKDALPRVYKELTGEDYAE